MAQILDLGKVRFNWAGTYSPTTQYEYNDLVTYGPSLYAFTSATAATGVEPTNPGSWTLVVEGFDWRGTYATGTQYFKNDVVTDNVSAFICTTKHTAADADINDNENFSILALGQTDLPSQITAINKVLASNGVDPQWVATTYLTKGYWGSGQGQTAVTVESSKALTNAISVYAGTANDFLQFALANTSNAADASADFIAYNDTGDNDSGFIDVGITSSAFADPEFTITGPNDGYLFMSAPRGVQRSVLIKQLLSGTYTLTLDASHGWVAGNTIRVEGVDANIDGQHVITGVPAANKVSFAAATGAIPYTPEDVDPVGKIYRPVGDGNLVFATDASGLENRIVFAAGGYYSNNTQMVIIPDTQVHIEIATQSTSPTTGALAVIGGIGISGNLNASGYLSTNSEAYVGSGAKTFETDHALTDAVAVFSGATDSFAQIAFSNATNDAESSADFLAYSIAGDNDSGWIDMGITNPAFDSATYGVTGRGDGYIFMSGVADRTKTVTNRSRSAGVATLTVGTNHKIYEGDEINVTGLDASFNGDYTVIARTETTISYTNIGSDVTAGGVNGTVVAFGGNGNLVLATSDTGVQNRIVFAAGGLASGNEQMIIAPDQFVHIEIATASTSPTTGALIVAGGIGLSGNLNTAGGVNVEGFAAIGNGAPAFVTDAALTNPVAAFKFDNESEDASFAQLAFQNADATSSTDIIVYMDNGDDEFGWMGMGIAGSEFDDATYGITGPGDGYIFHDTKDNTYTGNLVIATGDSGSENKIILAAGGFASGTTQMEITPNQNVHFEISTQSTSPTTGAVTIVGGLGVQGNINVAGNVNIAGTITFGGSGTTVETENLAVTDPMIFVGTDNLTDAVDLTFIGEYAGATTLDPAASITTRARTSNVATLGITYAAGTTEASKFKVGDSVVISNTGVAAFNGTKTITAVTGNTTSGTISYASTGSDVATEAASTEYTAAITNKALSGGIATLTAASHGFSIGEAVTVAGVDATFNGTYTITNVATNSFQYVKAVADVPSQPATTAFTTSVTSRNVTSNLATLTTSAAHGYSIGETVVVSGFTSLSSPLNGTWTITATPSATTFRFAIVTGDLLEEGVTGVTAVVNRLIGTGKVYRVEGSANSTDVNRPRWAGLTRDASQGDRAFKLFQGLTDKPSTTVDFANVGISLAPLEISTLKATAITATGAVTATTAASSFKAITLTDTPSAATDAATVQYVKDAAASWTIKTANYTAVNGDMIWANTTGGAFTITLPASPATNARVRIGDVASKWDTISPIVARNGANIMGLAEDLTLNLKNAVVELVYSGNATFGWRVF
jgi:hypothetical protein